MPPRNETSFQHGNVYAVTEDEQGQPSEFIDQRFALRLKYSPAASIICRLQFAITDSASTETHIYLQVRADHVQHLENTTSCLADQTPTCLQHVHKRLGKRLITCLRFRLHRGSRSQLIVPIGFSREALDCTAQAIFDRARPLAAVSSFSVCFAHDLLPPHSSKTFVDAVEQSSTLTKPQLRQYERMSDISRLYHGNGGTIFTSEDEDGSLPDGEHCGPPTRSTAESCGSTVAFDTVPRCEGPPPQYDECPSEEQQPTAVSDATAMSAESHGGDGDPPEYEDAERQPNLSNAPKHVLDCPSEETETRQLSKRKRSSPPRPCTTKVSPGDFHRIEHMLQLQVAGSDCPQVIVKLVLEQQRQIERLQQDVEELMRQKKELEGWHDEVEATSCDLEYRQDEIDEKIDSLFVQHDEHQGECEKLGSQMQDIHDDMDACMKGEIGDRMEELMAKEMGDKMEELIEKKMADFMRQIVKEQVAAQMAQMKAKMCKALGD